MKVSILAGMVLAFVPASAWAVSPRSVMAGAELFTRQWEPQNPSQGGDGLGPLFNGESCATCHQQGGMGGAGEAAFNANSIGIDSIEVFGREVTNAVLGRLVSQLHPGFIQSDGSVQNVLPLPHHGGSAMSRQLHDTLTVHTAAEYDDAGGPTAAAEVRIANGTPFSFDAQVDGYRIRISARLYGRNTTALFGSGFIDRVSDKLLERQVQIQKQHPEISGRPSTLVDGRYGKFGWRANIASLHEFNEQACANEMGLQTRRKAQAKDSTDPNYQNMAPDISDEQLQMLTHFVAALPSPRQLMPNDPASIAVIERGAEMFHQVGCAGCHVRDMSPANGIYSDLLLHDMGYDSIDLSHAEPYIVRRELVTKEVEDLPAPPPGFTATTAYYGTATVIAPVVLDDVASFESGRPTLTFRAPKEPTMLAPFRVISAKRNPDQENNAIAIAKSFASHRKQNVRTRLEIREEMHLQPTNFNQEWRTAPLWGVRDSAPYWHDGRAETILEAIALHDGEAAGTRDRFLQLSYDDRQHVLDFLDSLVAPSNPSARR